MAAVRSCDGLPTIGLQKPTQPNDPIQKGPIPREILKRINRPIAGKLFFSEGLRSLDSTKGLIDEIPAVTQKNPGESQNHIREEMTGPHLEKEASFFTIKDIFNPFQIAMEKLPADFDGKIEIGNHYDFRDLASVSIE